MDYDFHPEEELNRERPAVLYADGHYLAIVGLAHQPDEATRLPITQLKQGSVLHRLCAGEHVQISVGTSHAYGWIRESVCGGYELELGANAAYALQYAAIPPIPTEAFHTTSAIIRQQLVEHLYQREELTVALALDEPYATEGADEDHHYHNGAITALCELALRTGLHQFVAAADLQTATAIREAADESIEKRQRQLTEVRQQIVALENSPAVSHNSPNPYRPDPSGREQLTRRQLELEGDITFARALLRYLDGESIEPD